MDEHEHTPGHDTTSMADDAKAVGNSGNTVSTEGTPFVAPIINSVERELPREHAAPDVQSAAPTNPDDPSATRLDWIDPDALEALKRRRLHDLAAGREGMQTPDWTVPSRAPSGADEPPPAGGAGVVPPATTSTSTTEPLATPPDSVSKRFLQAGHRYFLRDGSREVAFEDRGVRMVTAHNRPDVAESMAEMALAKGWTHIRVKGHEDFRRAVWLEAAVRGVGVTGYVPSEVDRSSLAELMQARMTNRVEPVGVPGVSPAAAGSQPLSDRQTTTQSVPDSGWTGQLIRHGAAPYQHEANGARSYFVTLRDSAGSDKTMWGVDLERAMQASGAQPGQTITLSNLGRLPVTVNEPVRDAAGQVIGEQPKAAERNVWKVEMRGIEAAKDEPARIDGSAQPSSVPVIVSPRIRDQLKTVVVPGAVPRAADDVAGLSPETEFRGELVAHGRAPYQNRIGAQTTYFATLREADGHPLTVWGADLERVIAASGAQTGDPIHLANYGRRRVDAEVVAVDGRGEVTGTEQRTIERYVWGVTIEPREPRDRPPAIARELDDPQRVLHLRVIAEAMRAQGFSEKSVAKVQVRAGEVMDQLQAQGVQVPAPRVFDPAGRVQQRRSRGNAVPSVPEVERVVQPATPAVPSR